MVIHHDKFIAKISQLNSIIKDDANYADGWEAAFRERKTQLYKHAYCAELIPVCGSKQKK